MIGPSSDERIGTGIARHPAAPRTLVIAVLLALFASASHATLPARGAIIESGSTGTNAPTSRPPSTDATGALEARTFDKLYEPSGVTRLGDGTLIVIEDEPRRAMRRVTIAVRGDTPAVGSSADGSSTVGAPPVTPPTPGAIAIVDEKRLKRAKGTDAGVDVGELDDLEGIARDAADRVFVVGSHDDAEERLGSDRRKLVRYTLRDDRMANAAMTRRLRRDLLDAHPAIAAEVTEGGRIDGTLNIEALAFDRRRGELLIGLRTPRIDKDAVVVRLTNPDAYVEGTAAAAFADAPWTLDLDKGGLRALAYDDRTDQLLMISRRESGGGGAYKLWRTAADGSSPPSRIRLPDENEPFDDVEGLVPLDDTASVLFVRDDGNRDEREGGSWFAVSRERLGLE